MGLHKPIAAGGVFLRILDGNIVQKSTTEKPGYELYKTKNPQTDAPVEYWIERYGFIDGLLVKIDRVEKPDKHIYGWKLHLLDDMEYLLDLKDGSPTTRRVLAMLPNVQLDERLTIKVFKDKEGYNAIQFVQNGENVPQYWNKETLPEPRKIGGKLNFSEGEAIVYDATIKLAEDIFSAGKDALESYQNSVRDAVQNDSYTGPRDDERIAEAEKAVGQSAGKAFYSDPPEMSPTNDGEPPDDDFNW